MQFKSLEFRLISRRLLMFPKYKGHKITPKNHSLCCGSFHWMCHRGYNGIGVLSNAEITNSFGICTAWGTSFEWMRCHTGVWVPGLCSHRGQCSLAPTITWTSALATSRTSLLWYLDCFQVRWRPQLPPNHGCENHHSHYIILTYKSKCVFSL